MRRQEAVRRADDQFLELELRIGRGPPRRFLDRDILVRRPLTGARAGQGRVGAIGLGQRALQGFGMRHPCHGGG